MSMPSFARRDLLRYASLTAASALAPFGCCPKPPEAPGWQNAVGTVAVSPDLLFEPSSAKELVGLIHAAETADRRIRMTGSGHSFSDVALTEDYLLLPTRLNRVLELDRSRLKPEKDDPHLVRVQSGATIRELNAELDKRDLAFDNLGGFDGQTIAGVAMTATHGSGMNYGPIVDQIVSFQVVTTGGELLQLEPTDGITRPDLAGALTLEEDGNLRVRLIQNDDWFRAIGVSMGCMGIVYAVVLRATDKFWLRERRTIARWSQLAAPRGYIERLINGEKLTNGASDPEHVEIYVNPYPTPKNGKTDHTCIVTERYRLSAPPPRTPENRRRGRLDGGHFFADQRARGITEEVLRATLDTVKGPALHQVIEGMLTTLEDPDFSDISYRVFNIGDLNYFRVYGIEMAFPATQTIPAVQELFRGAAEEERAGRHHSVPVSLRFVNESPYFLAMQQGRKTMMMEIGMLVAARGAEQLLRNYQRRFLDAPHLSARPHWGLDLSILQGKESVAALYPMFPKWLDVYSELNAKGAFDGHLTDRLGISRKPREH